MATKKKSAKRKQSSRSTLVPRAPHRMVGLSRALEDVLGRSPRKITVETARPVRGAVDEDDPWSGNIYKYSF